MASAASPAIPEPACLLALDVGSRRVGLAMTVALGFSESAGTTPGEPRLHVQPLFTMERKGDRADVKSIGRVVRKHGITEIVVGHPLALSGERTAQTLRVERFADELRVALALPVHLHDERLSTVAAHEHLERISPRSRTKAGLAAEKGIIDQVAAVLILEGFLTHRAHLRAIARARAGDSLSAAPDSPVPASDPPTG